MSCPVGVVEQFSSYAICSPNLWMIIACTFMTLLTMLLLVYLQHGFKRDIEWLRFAHWKFQQLAERLRFQEPNVTLLEGITRKLHEKKPRTDHTFEEFFQKSREDSVKKLADKDGPANGSDVLAENVKRAKEADAEKVFRDTNIDSKTPLIDNKSDNADSGNILKKWTDATKDILAIDDEDQKPKKNNSKGSK